MFSPLSEPIMRSFEWIDATSVEHAATLLAESRATHPVIAKAGGIDLIDLMKEGIVRPDRVVNLRSIPGLGGIGLGSDGSLRLGALATLAQIEADAQVRELYPALAAAAGHASTPQVRNAATIGGNLLQRPRCWYFRNALFHQDGVDIGDAIARGEHQYHAIFDNARSALVHASTPATALVAYGASVRVTGHGGQTRTIPLDQLLLPPDPSRDRDAAIAPGEILSEVVVPPTGVSVRAAYHKQTERDSYDWPICDVAVVLHMDGEAVGRAAIVMGWVAPTPRRAHEAEALLSGGAVHENLCQRAARAAVERATPLAKNAYKVPVLEAVLRRTIMAAWTRSAA
jgi:xanthine dehydrogenase YagS FAD-binding subunit